MLEQALAVALRDEFERAYRAASPRACPMRPTPRQAGARSLRNLCLRYLGALDDDRAHALARRAVRRGGQHDRFRSPRSRRCAIRRSPARDALFARFEARWRDEPLVLDKWFALQARSLRPIRSPRVRALIAHPRFNARNPNRVRSLVGTFALGNFARFNARDGSGYAFAAEQVRALDATNPQLASTIAGAFNLWKRFAEPRRTQMQRCLSGSRARGSCRPT